MDRRQSWNPPESRSSASPPGGAAEARPAGAFAGRGERQRRHQRLRHGGRLAPGAATPQAEGPSSGWGGPGERSSRSGGEILLYGTGPSGSPVFLFGVFSCFNISTMLSLLFSCCLVAFSC